MITSNLVNTSGQVFTISDDSELVCSTSRRAGKAAWRSSQTIDVFFVVKVQNSQALAGREAPHPYCLVARGGEQEFTNNANCCDRLEMATQCYGISTRDQFEAVVDSAWACMPSESAAIISAAEAKELRSLKAWAVPSAPRSKVQGSRSA